MSIRQIALVLICFVTSSCASTQYTKATKNNNEPFAICNVSSPLLSGDKQLKIYKLKDEKGTKEAPEWLEGHFLEQILVDGLNDREISIDFYGNSRKISIEEVSGKTNSNYENEMYEYNIEIRVGKLNSTTENILHYGDQPFYIPKKVLFKIRKRLPP